MIIPSNWDMHISFLKINRESVITLLSKFTYLSYSRHPKRRYVNVAIKSLKAEYRS